MAIPVEALEFDTDVEVSGSTLELVSVDVEVSGSTLELVSVDVDVSVDVEVVNSVLVLVVTELVYVTLKSQDTDSDPLLMVSVCLTDPVPFAFLNCTTLTLELEPLASCVAEDTV